MGVKIESLRYICALADIGNESRNRRGLNMDWKFSANGNSFQ